MKTHAWKMKHDKKYRDEYRNQQSKETHRRYEAASYAYRKLLDAHRMEYEAYEQEWLDEHQ